MHFFKFLLYRYCNLPHEIADHLFIYHIFKWYSQPDKMEDPPFISMWGGGSCTSGLVLMSIGRLNVREGRSAEM